jgi:hypothetical protein
VGGEQRGYDGGKKVHSVNVPDQDGLRLLLDSARIAVSGLKHLWLDVGYDGRGKHWVEEVLGLSVEIVRRPPKPIAGKRARTWSQEEWAKEGKKVDWQKLMPPRVLWYCRGAGLWSAPSLGFLRTGA